MNKAVERALRDERGTPKKLTAEIARLRAEADNLVAFFAEGDSSTVRERLRGIEQRIAIAEAELAAASSRAKALPPKVHREWLVAKLERLQQLLAKNPAAAKIEIARHLEGSLSLRSLPAEIGERGYEITGAWKAEGLLGQEEALRSGNSILVHCGGTIRKDRHPPWRSPSNPSNSRSICPGEWYGPDRPRAGPMHPVSGRLPGCPVAGLGPRDCAVAELPVRG